MQHSSHELIPPGVTTNQVHWHTTDLLEVASVLLVSEYEPVRIRQLMANHLDGRQVNDAFTRAVLAIRDVHELEPYAYVVVFPDEGFELPIDLRPITDDASRLAGFVKEPRGSSDVVFDCAQLQGVLADQLCAMPRSQAVSALKTLSSDGQEFLLHDRCSPDARFAHVFIDGAYHHNYRYVAAGRAAG